jgi:hypothetical protein
MTAPHTRREFWAKLLLEGALIVLSVVLGLALNEWRQDRADAALARTVLANFRNEMQRNLAVLEKAQPSHAEFARRLAAAASRPRPERTAFEVFVAEMPEGGLGGEPLGEAAWETASSTGALRLLPYETAARISDVYVLQRTSIGPTTQRTLDRVLAPENFDPARKAVMIRTVQMLMNELSTQEAYLIGRYRRALRELPAP